MAESILILASIWFIGGHIFAAARDAGRMRFLNALILFLLAGYAITVAQWQPNWADLAVGAAILAGGTIFFARGWMGGGGVKLFAVTGPLTLSKIRCRAVGAHRLAGGRIAALHDPMGREPRGIAIATAAIAIAFLRPGALLAG
ncbi:prepilin peptidase [Sinisalibacter lacisalsi]|uniref:Prepilin type IV endopeptidase peptidase domain-containing protein n=1 Tax=Sinisalibacter lacisalsi TaxID=1526570 RepID=A0ABQ1QJ72_9RHOB|nr:prepilin peptidase [Sinisalibacter lacisalsi]GGD28489.1 hypothetical protein GCM10011358_10780 [Sinisalibacter lacisalsi]